MSVTHHPTQSAAVPDESTLPGRVAGLRRNALLAAAGGLGVWLVLALFVPRDFFPAYLVAYFFFVGLGVGSLAALLLHHLVGGEWGFVIRRPLEASASTLPWMALLFLPLAASLYLGSHPVYEWSDPRAVHESRTLAMKAGYLSPPFWLARAALYLAVWSGLALVFRRNARAQDAAADPAPTRRNQRVAAPGLVAIFVTVTFAAIDWQMSIEPEWYSTIYGVLVLVSWVLSSLCVAVVVSTVNSAAATSTVVVCCPTESFTGSVKTLPAVTLMSVTVACWNPTAVTLTL